MTSAVLALRVGGRLRPPQPSGVRMADETGKRVRFGALIDPAADDALTELARVRFGGVKSRALDWCVLIGAAVLADPRMWSEDRLHLSSEGHARVAAGVLEALGLSAELPDWTAPLASPYAAPGVTARFSADVRWARRHLAPWVGRRLRGVSSGDGVTAKRPDLTAYDAWAGRSTDPPGG